MQPIKHIYIATCEWDFWMAKICLGSVRYWYPDLPVTLILDTCTGRFSGRELREMETVWKVRLLKTTPTCCGQWGKYLAFWDRPGERFLLLDADLVLLGPILEKLQAFPEDFILEWPADTLLKEEEEQAFALTNHLNVAEVWKVFPDYKSPGFFFNAGQMVGRGGLIRPEDFDPLVDRSSIPTRGLYPHLFRWQDQGALNFLLAEKVRLGLVTLKPQPIFQWAFSPSLPAFKISALRRKKGVPAVLHWAGPKLPFKASLPHSHVLHFYEAHYYRRVPWGTLKKWLRFWKRIRSLVPGHRHELMHQIDSGPWLRTRIFLAELWPRRRSHFPKIVKMAGG